MSTTSFPVNISLTPSKENDNPSADSKSNNFLPVSIHSLSPSLSVYSAPFNRSGMAEIGVRMTAIQLDNNQLLIYNPIKLNQEVRNHLAALGSVRYVVIPNNVHHVFVDEFLAEYPQAECIGNKTIKGKHEKEKWFYTFDDQKGIEEEKHNILSSDTFNSLSFLYFPGFAQQEILVFHHPSSSLLCGDMLWNLPANQQYEHADVKSSGFIQKQIDKRMNPDYNQGKSLSNFEWMSHKNDEHFRSNLQKVINDWKPKRIVPQHGDIIEENSTEKLKQIYGWALGKK